MPRQGDWICPICGDNNFASRAECRRCPGGSTRPIKAEPPAATTRGMSSEKGATSLPPPTGTANGPSTTVKVGDWLCPCGCNNFSSRATCFKCQKLKVVQPATKPSVAAASTDVRVGDWTCACGANNFSNRGICFKCRSPKPPGVSSIVVESPVPMRGMSSDWRCLVCRASNFCSRPTCAACKTEKGATSLPPPTGTANGPSTTVKVGDWLCPCGCNNFSSRATCFKCQKPKNGVQQQPPAKAGDWACPKCNFSNFGSRTSCLKCGVQRLSASLTAGGTGTTPAASSSLDHSASAILGSFALPSYWNCGATNTKPELVETRYFSSVAAELWGQFSVVTKSRPITRVVRIENVALWHGYCAEVQRLVSKYPNQAAPIPQQWEPKTLQVLKDHYHINESYLCHGTSPAVAKMIVEGGFDPSYSGESSGGALFGQGTYFSDSLAKVMRYSKGCVVVARVALGEVALPPHSGRPSDYRRPPAKKHSTSSGEEYDSLVATAHSACQLKEFIVYRHTKAYPEYLIFHD